MHILYSVSLISRNGTTEQNKWWYYTPRIIISFHHLHVPKKLNLNANRHTIKTWKCKACTQLHFRLINIPLMCFKKVVCHFITISCSYSNVPVSEQNQSSSLQVNVKREAILKTRIPQWPSILQRLHITISSLNILLSKCKPHHGLKNKYMSLKMPI